MKSSQGNAFTLIELISVLFIMVIICGLLFSGVAAMRESGRRVECQNKLRQIGIGLQNFATSEGFLPPRRTPKKANWDSVSDSHVGIFAVLAPYLEIPEAGISDTAEMPNIYQCPSSPMGLSYRVNAGPLYISSHIGRYDGDGIVRHLGNKAVTMSEILDGLSYTTAFAERITLGDIVRIPNSIFSATNYQDIDTMQANCRDSSISSLGLKSMSEFWLGSSTQAFGYDHFNTPNSPKLDCLGKNSNPFLAQLVASRSKHPGGLLSVKLDGSVSWNSDSIDRAVWRELGTRSGREKEWLQW